MLQTERNLDGSVFLAGPRSMKQYRRQCRHCSHWNDIRFESEKEPTASGLFGRNEAIDLSAQDVADGKTEKIAGFWLTDERHCRSVGNLVEKGAQCQGVRLDVRKPIQQLAP